MHRLGIDVGGTFTDVVLLDGATGRLEFLKTPSTPGDPSRAVFTGVTALRERGVDPAAITYFVHGTTLAVNTVVQRVGVRVGALVTQGFRDLLEIGRGRLPVIHDFNAGNLPNLTDRSLVAEVEERLLADGEVRTPLNLDQCTEAARRLLDRGAEAIAVCFLHSYRNPAHEREAVQHLRRVFPDVYFVASHEVWPQVREYERAVTTVINAYIGRPMAAYYGALERGLAGLGVPARVYVTKSNGGVMTARRGSQFPVETLLSGPASGVIGGGYLARQAGIGPVICLDMGGTTADIAVVDGEPAYTYEATVAGLPLVLPSIDVASIGAGGGSIAWLDGSGLLRVGPMSAGADPGPACYGKGGEQPAVTDAYVTLGYIHPERFLDGSLPLDASRARAALARLGARLGESPEPVAQHIIDVATANMYAQLVPMLARQGVDPRDFSLLAYGGAGPTHAFFLAEEVGFRQVVVPMQPGGLSALGCLVAAFRGDFVRTLYRPLADLHGGELEAIYKEMETAGLAWLSGENVPVEGHRFLRTAEMRYVGQSFEIAVPLPAPLTEAAAGQAFHERYAAIYQRSDPEAPVEAVDLRLQVVGLVRPPELPLPPPTSRARVRPREQREVLFGDDAVTAQVYRRSDLGPGAVVRGPAIVEQYDTTTVIPRGWRVQVDSAGNLRGEMRR